MSRAELWNIYVRKNPQFADDHAEIKLTGRGLRKLFEQTYDYAHDQGFGNGRAFEAQKAGRIDSSLFERVFGRTL